MSDLLWLASLTKFNGFKVHPCRIYQDLISFYFQITFHCMGISYQCIDIWVVSTF